MANVYSGNASDVISAHRLDNKDTDEVGPAAYTLNGTAVFSGTSKFGSSLSSAGVADSLISDAALSGVDSSGTAKTLTHLWWRTDTLAGDQGLVTLVDSLGTSFMLRMLWSGGGSRFVTQWRRAGDVLEISSNPSLSTNTFMSLVFYIDASTATQGKTFVDGFDRTGSIGVTSIPGSAVIASPFVKYGNTHTNICPGRFVDNVVMIQSSGFSDAVVANLVSIYSETPFFGYRPIIASLGIASTPVAGVSLSIVGFGFGPDATVTINGIAAANTIVVNQGQIITTVPPGVSGDVTIVVKNVAANVTVTETALTLPSELKTNLWTENGLSTRLVQAGDNITPEMNVKAGDPLPIFRPRIRPTVWTKTGPLV